MQHYETPDIKYRRDGSIDIAHYLKIGRQSRAEQAHKLAKEVLPKRRFFAMRMWPLGGVRA